MNKNIQFIYSMFLIFLLPILIIAHTIWQIKTSNDLLNQELQKKTEAAASFTFLNLRADLSDTALTQQAIEQISSQIKEVTEISVFTPGTKGFQVIASTNKEILGLNFESAENAAVLAGNKIVTKQIIDRTKKPVERSFVSSLPVVGANNVKTNLIIVKLQPSETDTLAQKNLQQSLVILAFLVLIILLLLANQIRLSQYPAMYKKLEDIDKMKDEFISVASHELKTPLASAKGYSEMLLDGLTGKIDDKAKSHLEKILISVQRLDVLVNELLDVSRLQQDRMQFDMQPVDVHQIVENVVNISGEEAERKRLRLDIEHPKTPLPLVFSDPEKFQQVLENIISNSIKYTFKGGVRVSYKIINDKLRVSVKDTGIGMSEQDTKRVFEKFYRIKNEKTMNVPGTGLGLWIAREIMRHMNGEIDFVSIEGKGSEFFLTLPIIEDDK